MKLRCAPKTCSHHVRSKNHRSKNGLYARKSDRKTAQRYRCSRCGKSFSAASSSPCYRKKKRHLHHEIWRRYCSSDPQRRIARDLAISRTTVARIIKWLSILKAEENERFLEALGIQKTIYIDEMKTFIHSQCRPVTIAMAVNEHYKMLGFEISTVVPNSRRLIRIATKKYGKPKDNSTEGFVKLLRSIAPLCNEQTTIMTDKHPIYANLIKKNLTFKQHCRYKSKPAAIAGQGELKEKGKDPLFPINHVFAETRSRVARLARATWCTSKTIQGLADNLTVYMHYHNTVVKRKFG